jgi:hypothetical protein
MDNIKKNFKIMGFEGEERIHKIEDRLHAEGSSEDNN